jgi:uncharacterized membrane protein
MGPIGKATIVAVLGTVALVVAMGALEPDVPGALVAVYNLWLLATVVVAVVFVITTAFRFFAYLTGDERSGEERG